VKKLVSFFLFIQLAWSINLDRPVIDEARFLQPSEIITLEENVRSIFAQGGPQLGIVLLESLNGDVIENVSIKLAEQWKLGSKDKDNGLLIIVAKTERKMRLEVGQGLEGIITDYESNKIIRRILSPAFKSGRYFEGLTSTLQEISRLTELTDEERFKEQSQQKKPAPSKFLILLIVIIFIILRMFNPFLGMNSHGGRSSWGGGGFGGGGSWGGGGGGFSGGGSSGDW